MPIEAYWRTPLTDLGDKAAIKTLRALLLRGGGDSPVRIAARIGRVEDEYSVLLPEELYEVAEVPMQNEGRTLSLKISNENGGAFRLVGGVELEMSVRRRTE